MSRFGKDQKKEVPEMNMASMSDIVFMFLFFFMVITTMRESSLHVRTNLPPATDVQKLEKKSSIVNINIGPPNTNDLVTKWGPEPRIQLNDQYEEVKNIREFVEKEKQSRPESDRTSLTWSLKVDETVRMGIVTDVKQELRKASAFKVNYSAKKAVKR